MVQEQVKTQKSGKKWWKALIALLIAIGLVGGFLALNPHARDQIINALNLDPNQGAKNSSSNKAAKKGIQIPGYPEITLGANDPTMRVALTNPKDNPCYFEFTVKLKSTGEVLYKSQDVAPSKTINEEQLKRGLEAGKYPAVIEIRTKALKAPHAEMNGANVETQLVVQ
ncbi:MAG: hypothetical protein LBT80_04975 [Lactobacillaceae bacterium]|jgi:hypothetical protein|nr:hypothetical protein [Lactobacillaceae bacterium]